MGSGVKRIHTLIILVIIIILVVLLLGLMNLVLTEVYMAFLVRLRGIVRLLNRRWLGLLALRHVGEEIVELLSHVGVLSLLLVVVVVTIPAPASSAGTSSAPVVVGVHLLLLRARLILLVLAWRVVVGLLRALARV